MIDLNEKRQDIITVATELFEKFVSMPKNVRADYKKRTGIQVLVWEPGTRNLVMVSIGEPSEAARFFAVEKAVRSDILHDASSGNSEYVDAMQFSGSFSVRLFELPGGSEDNAGVLIASTSGLTGEEDAAVSAAVLAAVTGSSFVQICDNVDEHEGKLPYWYSDVDRRGYFQFLFE